MRGCSCRGTAGFVHVSCLAEQAKILVAEIEETNLDWKVKNERWRRWFMCSLCEQQYHGVVACALGWACWKTYVGRPEADQIRGLAMNMLATGLSVTGQHEDALSVDKDRLSNMRRIGASEANILVSQGNMACTYEKLGRHDEALSLRQEVYSGRLMLDGQEARETLREANNFASTLRQLNRFEEAKSLLRKSIPVARRVHGESDILTLRLRWCYAMVLYQYDGASLDDLREAMATLEETAPIARRVLGESHPVTMGIEGALRNVRAALRARDGSSVRPSEETVRAVREALAAMATSHA